MFRRLIIPAIVVSIVSILATVVWSASPPPIITYQGKVLVSGSPASTTLPMVFTIYNASSGGSALYTASGTVGSPLSINITPVQGLFTVYLGDNGTNPINPEIFKDNDSLYLQVIINGESLTPRKRLAATPYALNSKYLDGYIATSTATTTSQYIPVSDASGNFNLNNVTSTNIYVTNNNTSGVGGMVSVLSANGSNTASLFNYHIDSSTYHGILALYSSVDSPSIPSLLLNAAPGGDSWMTSRLSIGTTTPSGFDLNVVGHINFTGNLYQDGVLFSSGALPTGILGQLLVHDGASWVASNTFSTTTYVRDVLPSSNLVYTLGNSSSRFSEGWFENVYVGSSTWKLGQSNTGLFQITDINTNTPAFSVNNQGYLGLGAEPTSARVTIKDDSSGITSSLKTLLAPSNFQLDDWLCAGGGGTPPTGTVWDAQLFAYKEIEGTLIYSLTSTSFNIPSTSPCSGIPNWSWSAPVGDTVDGYLINFNLSIFPYNNWNAYATTTNLTFTATAGDYDRMRTTTGDVPFEGIPTSTIVNEDFYGNDSFRLSYDDTKYASLKVYDTGALSIRTNGSLTTGIYLSENGRVGIGTTTTDYQFNVKGSVNITGQYLVNGIPFSGMPVGSAGQTLVNEGGSTWSVTDIFKINTTTYSIAMNDSQATGPYSFSGGSNNNASMDYSTVAGGYSNTASNNYSFIGGGASNLASGFASFVGGGLSNVASTDYATVAGGSGNTASGLNSFVGGGINNTAAGNYSTVFGLNMFVGGTGSFGINLDSTSRSIVNSYTMAIMGGNVGIGAVDPSATLTVSGTVAMNYGTLSFNGSAGSSGNILMVNPAGLPYWTGTSSLGIPTLPSGTYGQTLYRGASDWQATDVFKINDTLYSIASGYQNFASGIYSTVLGGTNNSSTAMYSFIGGGQDNFIDGSLTADRSAILGGLINNISGGWENLILGGRYNTINYGSGNNILGGATNIIGGNYNNIIGSSQSFASSTGGGSMVLGGVFNTSTGYRSYALGRNMDVSGNYSFGINLYNPNIPQTLSQDNTFAILGGNVGVGTTTPSFPLTVSGDVNITGQYRIDGVPLSTGASLPSGSFGETLVNAGGTNWVTTSAFMVSTTGNNIFTSSSLVNGSYNVAFGYNNIISEFSSHSYSTIAGGRNNRAGSIGDYTFVGGGYNNSAPYLYTAVVGGYQNWAGRPYVFMGGGSNNIGYISYGVISGGSYNTLDDAGVTAQYSFIGAGLRNYIKGDASSIVGGKYNTSTGNLSFIGGGQYNYASATGSFILGSFNTSSGQYSIAIGRNIEVSGENSFGINVSTTPALLNQSNTIALMGGNVGIGTVTPNESLTVVGNINNSITNDSEVVQISTASLAGGPFSIFVSGKYAYTANYSSSNISVVDISNPFSPAEVSTTTVDGFPRAIFVSGKYAYTANYGSNNISIVDISNPSSPVVVSTTSVGSSPYAVFVSGKYAYTANFNSNDISIVDISNPSSPVVVSTTFVGSSPQAIFVSGKYAYTTNYNSNDISIVDISNPSSPIIISTTSVLSRPSSIYVSGKYAYVAHYLTSNNISIVDISNPSSPVVISTTSALSRPNFIYVSGKYAYIANYSSGAISIIDVSDPYSPNQVSTALTGSNPTSIYVSGKYAYTANYGSNNISVIDITGTEAPSLIAHSAEAGNLSIRNDLNVKGSTELLSVTVGQGGLFSQGPASFGSGIFLASTTPVTTSYSLYNQGGDLYWNGSMINSGTVLPSGNPGEVFMVSSTGQPYWTNTSSLGISGGSGSLPSGSAGQILYNNGSDWAVTNNIFVSSSGNIGMGTITPSSRLTLDNDGGILAVGTHNSGNSIIPSGAGTRMLWYPRKAAFRAGYVNGSQWDEANIGLYSVAFGQSNTSSGHTSVVSGGYLNTASGPQSFVGAGRQNSSTANYTVVVGGQLNSASADVAVVVGGTSNKASGLQAVVVGGQDNIVSGMQSFIGGGVSNRASFSNSSVVGGLWNIASGQYSFVGGGMYSYATGQYSSVVGGQENVASGMRSVALGGYLNVASATGTLVFGYQNIASGQYSSVLGGYNNRSIGDYSSVLGGYFTTTTGRYSISGGYYNDVSGDYSLAFGRNMRVVASSSFGINLNSGLQTINQANTMAIMGGNVGIGTSAPSSSLHIDGGGLLVTGSAGATPVSGTGTRMMWVPSKGAFRAGVVEGDKWNSENIGLYSAVFGYDNKGVGESSFIGGGQYNIASSTFTSIIGGESNYANEVNAAIIGGKNNTSSGWSSVIVGGYKNEIFKVGDTAYEGGFSSFIGGGYQNIVKDQFSAILVGQNNTISSSGWGYSAIIAGQDNFIEDGATVILGGRYNTSTGWGSIIAGGSGNEITDDYSIIAGGRYNTILEKYSFIGGGQHNTSTGESSFIAGGEQNMINSSGTVSFIGGGFQNVILNQASFIGGGSNNIVSGTLSFIAGGENNIIGGKNSFIGAGKDSEVNGDYSAAFGLGIEVNGNNSFGISLDNIGGYTIENDTTMAIMGGYVGINTTNSPYALQVFSSSTNLTIEGHVSPDDGSWQSSSDQRLKKNISDFTGGLEKVMAIRSVNYNFNFEPDNAEIKRIGFLAQEIENILPQVVGTDPRTGMKSISYANLTPILVQAIQEQQAQIDALKNASTTLTVENSGSTIVYTVDMGMDIAGRPLLNVASVIGVDNKWEIDTTGLLKSKISTSEGDKEIYGLTSEDAEITLSGNSQLQSGEASIVFGTSTYEIIDDSKPMKVSITLTADEPIITFVKEKSARGFIVKQAGGGSSSATFDWIVIAKRKFTDSFVEEIINEDEEESYLNIPQEETPPPTPPQEGGEGEVITPPLQGGEEGVVETPPTTEEDIITNPLVETESPVEQSSSDGNEIDDNETSPQSSPSQGEEENPPVEDEPSTEQSSSDGESSETTPPAEEPSEVVLAE